MKIEKVTPKTSKILADTRRVYSYSALNVTIQLSDTDTNSCPTFYLVTMTKEDLESFLKLITDRENEIKGLLK